MLSDDEVPRQLKVTLPATLCFHKVTPQITFGSTNYSPRRLWRLLSALRMDGYSFTGDRAIQITFDDAYAHLTKALPPLMEEFGVRPLVFVPTGWIGEANRWDYSNRLVEERHLSIIEIKGLKEMGVRFGSHGHGHVDLVGLDDQLLRSELTTSRRILEDIIGEEVSAISYPFGRVDTRVMAVASAAGYSTGFTMRYPTSEDSPLGRGRYSVYFYDTPASLRRKLGSGIGYRFERARAGLTNRLSYGTILLNRVRRRWPD